MRQGDDVCRFEVTFFPAEKMSKAHATPEQIARREQQQKVDNLVLSLLPLHQGITLTQLQGLLQMQGQVPVTHQRVSRILESLQHLSHAGLVANTANQPGDTLTNRRYWRAPTFDI
jgi:hypothetical protein